MNEETVEEMLNTRWNEKGIKIYHFEKTSWGYIWKEWYDNGRTEKFFKLDNERREHGLCTEYLEDGTVFRKNVFRHGEKDQDDE